MPAKASDAVIDVQDVWKIYQMGEVEVPALRGMKLRIKNGEFVSIMGPSGSGKSTAMHIVGCLDVPTKGNVYLDGKNIAHMSESQLARIRGKKIGFIFQTFHLIPSLDALENVMLPMIFQKMPLSERRERAKMLLERVGLGDRLHHTPSELSGGQRQRVAIARALANDPEVILADEPTGNLDSKTGGEVMKFLQELHVEFGKTMIIVTHDRYVAEHADRIVNLFDGQIVKDDNNHRKRYAHKRGGKKKRVFKK